MSTPTVFSEAHTIIEGYGSTHLVVAKVDGLAQIRVQETNEDGSRGPRLSFSLSPEQIREQIAGLQALLEVTLADGRPERMPHHLAQADVDAWRAETYPKAEAE